MKFFDLFKKKSDILTSIPFETEYYQLMRYCNHCEDYYPDYNKKTITVSLKKIGEQFIMTTVYECPMCGKRSEPKEFAITEERYNQILRDYKSIGGK